MPRIWTDKDERQYKHIMDSAKARGRSPDRAREIAARTVNKQRFAEGRTSNHTSSGTGNPHSSLDDRSRRELYNRARELHISGRSTMNKDELVKAIRARQ